MQVKKVRFLVTAVPGAMCGVVDYTQKLADAMLAEGVDAGIEIYDRWSLKSLADIADKYSGSKDTVLHLQYPSLGMGKSIAPAFLPLAAFGTPVYATLHEFSVFNILRKAIFFFNVMLLKKTVFTNEFEKNRFLSYVPFAARKTTIIPIGNNISVVPSESDRKTLPERIIYFGQISENKGIEFFIETIGKLRAQGLDFEAAIIGSVLNEDSDITRAVRKAVAEYDIKPFFNMSADDVSRELNRSTVAVLPFPDGITEKRGSALACLKHEVSVITIHSEKTSSWLSATTHGADTPDDAVRLISGMMEGTVERQPAKATLKREMELREWANIARNHLSLYQNA